MIKYLQILLLSCTQMLIGQNTAYQSGAASANLIMPLSIEAGNGDLDFGDIILYGSPITETISPKNGKEFVVKGQSNRNISVIFNDVELNNLIWLSQNGGKSGNLTFIPEITLENSRQVKSGDNLILEPEGLIGSLRFNVGGTIKLKSNQPIGNYEGQFIISVSY